MDVKKSIYWTFQVVKNIVLKIQYGSRLSFNGIASIGKKVDIYVEKNARLILKNRVRIRRNGNFTVREQGLLRIGENVFFNTNCSVVCKEGIEIGDGCSFGPNVCIYDHDHRWGYQGIEPGFKTKQVHIGDNCWIGANSVILKGTVIGEKSIIGAGVVVSGDIPPHSIVKNNRELIIEPIIEKEEKKL